MRPNDSTEMAAQGPITVVGAGLIGASWAALFLSAGYSVRVYDADAGSAERVRRFIGEAWGTLSQLRTVVDGWDARISFHASPAAAVTGAQFVQESLPERLDVKHQVYQSLEPALSTSAVVATSSSGLLLSDMQRGWRNPSRFILGHPYNPPHLIPLVELLGNQETAAGVIETAHRFYTAIGKVPITMNKEVPGHVANRLQAALWREAINLVASGVASVADVDKAVAAGPGLRWAVMGPHMLFNLGGGDGGMEEFCRRYTDSFHTWWDSMSGARITPEVRQLLIEGVRLEAEGRSLTDLARERDRKLQKILTTLGQGT